MKLKPKDIYSMTGCGRATAQHRGWAWVWENNTICSKSNDIKLTNIGLEMKSAIEQFREQAANVE